MKKLTLSALVAIGFFTSGALSRQDGNNGLPPPQPLTQEQVAQWCDHVHKSEHCAAPARRRQGPPQGGPKPRLPNICDQEVCLDFIGHHSCFPACAEQCEEGDQDCLGECAACRDPEPPKSRRQDGNGLPPPQPLTQEQVAQWCDEAHKSDHCAHPASRRQGPPPPEGGPKPRLPNICDPDTCLDFIGHHSCFPACAEQCEEGDQDCLGECAACRDPEPPKSRRQDGNGLPPPQPLTQEQVAQWCDEAHKSDHCAHPAQRRQGPPQGGPKPRLPNICDQEVCLDFIGHHSCFPACAEQCEEGDQDCLGECAACRDPEPPKASRRRHSLRKAHY